MTGDFPLQTRRRPSGSGEPSQMRIESTDSSKPRRLALTATPWLASNPRIRLIRRVRSFFSVRISRYRCRPSSCSGVGTSTTLQSFFSPAW